MSQLNDYECFINAGVYGCNSILEGYKKIHVHLVFDVKYDRCHKAHLVGDGHCTDIPLKSINSGVVSLNCNILIVMDIQMSGSAFDSVNPISQRHLEVHNPYSALEIMRMCPSISPNSGPLTITSFSAV
jgi:hypothetical protein